MPTPEECKKILFKLGLKHGVSPKLISEKLLSKEDKEDMVNGQLPYESLDAHVRVWKEHGLGHYSGRSGELYNAKPDLPMPMHRVVGKR